MQRYVYIIYTHTHADIGFIPAVIIIVIVYFVQFIEPNSKLQALWSLAVKTYIYGCALKKKKKGKNG